MIMIEVEVPMLGRRYDFQIDENMLAGAIVPEIADMICRREQCVLTGDENDLRIWDAQTGRQLDRTRTAFENGLRTGSRVLLV